MRFRLTLATIIAAVLLCISCGVLIGVAGGQHPANTRVDRANTIVSAWNDMAASMREENLLLDELQENLKANPPVLVFDPRRHELYQLVITEHQRQLHDFKTMQEADK